MKAAFARHREQGLTLLELLLTVTIFSLVVAVFSQALFQVGVLERATARHLGQWQREWLQGFALDDYFAAQVEDLAIPVRTVEGDATHYRSTWVEQAGRSLGRVQAVTLTLRAQAPAGPGWELVLQSGEEPDAVLAQWAQPLQFRFVDARGRSSERWPGAQTAPGETVPSAVQLVDANAALLHHWPFAGWTQPSLVRPGAAAAFAGGGAP